MDEWIYNTPIAHRGFHSETFPENSLGSFKEAITRNYAIELDIRLTSDKEIVVFHDIDLKRVCNSKSLVSEKTLEQLLKMKILSSSETIPSLDMTLELINGQVPILIEIKNENFDGEFERILIERLNSYKGSFAIQSFNPWSLKEVKKLNPSIKTGLLSGSFSKSKLGLASKFVLRNLFLTPIISPDFFSLELQSYNGLQKSVRALFGSKKVIFWTIKTKEKADMLKRINKNFIFEGFEN